MRKSHPDRTPTQKLSGREFGKLARAVTRASAKYTLGGKLKEGARAPKPVTLPALKRKGEEP